MKVYLVDIPSKFLVESMKTAEIKDPTLVTCNRVTYLNCLSNFGKALGYTTGQLPSNAQQFIAQLQNLMYKYGASGFTTICRYSKAVP